MQGSKATHTPVEVSSKLQPATNKDDPVYQTEYHSTIEGLTYLAVSTRPDIAFFCQQLSMFQLRPSKGTLDSPKANLKISKMYNQYWYTTYINKISATNVLDTVIQTGIVIIQTESQPQVTFLC